MCYKDLHFTWDHTPSILKHLSFVFKTFFQILVLLIKIIYYARKILRVFQQVSGSLTIHKSKISKTLKKSSQE